MKRFLKGIFFFVYIINLIIYFCEKCLIKKLIMAKQEGFNKKQTKEVIVNALIFAVQMIIFYAIEKDKMFAALAIMASLFSMYSISLSKSDVKSTIIGSLSVNILISIFFITYYFNNYNVFFIIAWTSITIWFTYKLIEKFKL